MINKNKKTLTKVIIIPARLDSSRLKKKLLRNIAGLPMIIRVAKNALKLKIGRVLVGTDSKEIFQLCEKNNIEVFMTNKNHQSGTDRINEVCKLLDEDYDLVVNLQGDLPFFKKELFQKIFKLFSDESVDIGSAICDLNTDEIEDNNIVKAIVNLDDNETGFALDFRRDISKIRDAYHHIGIYVYKRSILNKFVDLPQSHNEIERKLEQMRALDNNLKIKLVKIPYNPPSVDTIEDLQKIRLHFKKNNL